MPAIQQTLFETAETDPLLPSREKAEDLRNRGIHFGTSTWSYPGWAGIVYTRKHSSALSYLREYVQYPLFSTVGADFTFYGPANPNQLAAWKSVLPTSFKMVFKVWEEFTVERYLAIDERQVPTRREGQTNPRYLDAALFEDAFVAPFLESGFKSHVACFLFEFRSSTGKQPEGFIDRVGEFLSRLPESFRYAIEIREPKVLGEKYRQMLGATRASHVFNHWDRMPSLAEQRAGGYLQAGDFFVSRILTPLKMPYAVAKKKFAPYNKLEPKNVLEQMRKDVVELCLDSIQGRLPGYVLVNNRAEGCAPLTIQALEEDLTNRLRETP